MEARMENAVFTYQAMMDILAHYGLFLARVTNPKDPKRQEVALVRTPPYSSLQKAVRVINWTEKLRLGTVYDNIIARPFNPFDWPPSKNGNLGRMIPVSEIENIVDEARKILDS